MGTRYFYREYKEEGYIRLCCEKDETLWLSVDVYPKYGFKSCGLNYRGDWLQPYHPHWSHLLKRETFGNNVLYPTPNRVRGQSFTFEGQHVEMIKHGTRCDQHGLAWDSPWVVKEIKSEDTGVSVTAEFAVRRGDENYAAYPYESILTLTYLLTEDGLTCRYQVKNIGGSRMPFGIGFHPWFLLPPATERVTLKMPAGACFETTEDLLPTGRLITVEGKKGLDLNRFCPVRELNLDTVFLTEAQEDTICYEDRGYQLVIKKTPEFQMGVVFTAFNRGLDIKGYEAFCVETQSCCTDAINMYEKGFRHSGLMILESGQTQSGAVQYMLQDTVCAEKRT